MLLFVGCTRAISESIKNFFGLGCSAFRKNCMAFSNPFGSQIQANGSGWPVSGFTNAVAILSGFLSLIKYFNAPESIKGKSHAKTNQATFLWVLYALIIPFKGPLCWSWSTIIFSLLWALECCAGFTLR